MKRVNWYTKSAAVPNLLGRMFRSRKDRILAVLQEYPQLRKDRSDELRYLMRELRKKPLHPDIILWVLDPKNRADAIFREEVLRQPDVPVEALRLAIMDPDPKISNMAAEHPNADNSIFELLATQMLTPDTPNFDASMLNEARLLYAFRNPAAPDWFRYLVLRNNAKLKLWVDNASLLEEHAKLKFGPQAVDKFTFEQKRSFMKEYRDEKNVVNQYVRGGGNLLVMAMMSARLADVRRFTHPLFPEKEGREGMD